MPRPPHARGPVKVEKPKNAWKTVRRADLALPVSASWAFVSCSVHGCRQYGNWTARAILNWLHNRPLYWAPFKRRTA